MTKKTPALVISAYAVISRSGAVMLSTVARSRRAAIDKWCDAGTTSWKMHRRKYGMSTARLVISEWQ